MKSATFLRLALVTALVGCASAQVKTDFDQNANFSDYQTYSWMNTTRMSAMAQATLFDRRLRAAVESQLAAKGLKKADGNGEADILIVYHAGVQDKLDVQQWGYFGRRWDVREYQQGTLIVDVVDAKSMSLVWRGTAIGETNTSNPSTEKLNQTVQKMFERFPPT